MQIATHFLQFDIWDILFGIQFDKKTVTQTTYTYTHEVDKSQQSWRVESVCMVATFVGGGE